MTDKKTSEETHVTSPTGDEKVRVCLADDSDNGYMTVDEIAAFGPIWLPDPSTHDPGDVLTLNGSLVPEWAPPSGGGGGGGLTGFAGTLETASPNGSVNFSVLSSSAATTDGGTAIVAKGDGPTTLQTPDGSSTGGNVRGTNAIDLQRSRSAAAHVASGANASALGVDNTASGSSSLALGVANDCSNTNSMSLGRLNTVSGNSALALGKGNTASGGTSVTAGENNTASGVNSLSLGYSNTADGDYAIATGKQSRTYASPGARAFSSGSVNAVGDMNVRDATLSLAIGGAGPGDLRLANTAGQYLVIPDKFAIDFQIRVVAQLDGTGDMQTWKVEGAAKRVAGTLTLVGVPTVTPLFGDSAMATASIAITADDTNKAINVAYTGPTGTTSYVNAYITQTEVKRPT